MQKLPKWCITDIFPAFYDVESATAIEQTAKLYGAMNTLIESYNEWVEKINADIEAFENSADENAKLFAMGLRQEFQDFINVIELNINSQDKHIADTIVFMKNNIETTVSNLIDEIKENGELDDIILDALNGVNKNLTELSEKYTELNLALETEQTARENNYTELTNKVVENNNTILSKLNVSNSATNGVLQRIYEVVESYLHNTDKLVYGHEVAGLDRYEGYNAFDYNYGVSSITRTLGDETKTGFCINCSTFVNLILLGVPFNKSMYNPHYNNLRKNCIGESGYSFNLWGDTITSENCGLYSKARLMAQRFDELGLGFRPNKNYSNICAGDVLFTGANGVETELSDITHCSIVLAKHCGELNPEYTPETANSTLRNSAHVLYTIAEVLESSSSLTCVRTKQIDSADLPEICYIGRPIFNSVPDNKKLLLYQLGALSTKTFDTSSLNLYSNDLITVTFDYTPSSINEYVNIWCNGTQLQRYIRIPTSEVTENELGVTQHCSFTVRLSDFGSVKGDYNTTKIESLRIASIADSNSVADIANVAIWKGVNGDFVNDSIITE